jgi:hypothetical protein
VSAKRLFLGVVAVEVVVIVALWVFGWHFGA